MEEGQSCHLSEYIRKEHVASTVGILSGFERIDIVVPVFALSVVPL